MAHYQKLFFRFAIQKANISTDPGSGDTIIHHVSVMTEGQAATHFIRQGEEMLPVFIDGQTLSTVKASADKFENGVKVKADHSGGIGSIIGRLRNFVIEGKQLFADFVIFKESTLFGHLMKLIETMPDAFGFSPSMLGPFQRFGDRVMARCADLMSVDLVTDPSTNPNGLFEVKVDTGEKGEGPEPSQPMDAEAIKQACEAAIKPHIDGLHTRLSALEASHKNLEASHKAMATKMEAASSATTGGAPSNPTDEEGLYSRFEKRIAGNVTAMVEQAAQASAKTLQALGLTLGKGPGPGVEVPGQKKVDDMTFMEVVEMEFSDARNQHLTDFDIIRKVTFAHPKKHEQAMKDRQLGKLPIRRAAYVSPGSKAA